jgi:hypothetical protein
VRDNSGPGRSAVAAAAVIAVSLASLFLPACRKRDTVGAEDPSRRKDALFLAEAPVFVPEEIESDLDAMGIARLYVVAASLSKEGRITMLPPPAARLKRPVVLTVVGEPDAATQLGSVKGEVAGTMWAKGVTAALAEAKTWGNVVGIHLHFDPSAANAATLADAIRALKKQTGGLPVSVTIVPKAPAESWKPLGGAADEALIFSFGRRPELGDRLVPELPDDWARAFPIPFRLLVAPGGWGRAGAGETFHGRRVPDGKINELSKSPKFDFHFGQVLSSEAGTLYTFKPRAEMQPAENPFTSDGGSVRFQILTLSDAVRFLAASSRWSLPNQLGRVFLLDGVPRDGHLLGFPAVKALLTGRSLEPRLLIEPSADASGPAWSEFSVKATNTGPGATDLSHYNNWLRFRVEGGVFVALRLGDFDRFDLLSSDAEGSGQASFGRAVVARVFENIWAPGEVNQTGAIRVNGTHPRVYVSSHLTLPDGKVVASPEFDVPLLPPPRERKKPTTAPVPKRRRR